MLDTLVLERPRRWIVPHMGNELESRSGHRLRTQACRSVHSSSSSPSSPSCSFSPPMDPWREFLDLGLWCERRARWREDPWDREPLRVIEENEVNWRRQRGARESNFWVFSWGANSKFLIFPRTISWKKFYQVYSFTNIFKFSLSYFLFSVVVFDSEELCYGYTTYIQLYTIISHLTM